MKIVVLIAIVAFVWSPTTARAQQSAQRANPAIERLIAMDRDAAARVSALTKQRVDVWRLVADRRRPASDNLDQIYTVRVGSLVRDSGELLAVERRIDRLLEDEYIAAAKDLRIDNRVRLVQLAALHWHSQVRRYVQRSLHTSVSGLDDDPRCRGDILADQMLLTYVRAVWGDRAADLARVTDSLLAIAAQTACLGSEQSETLASAVTTAFSDVEAFLRVNSFEWVVPSLTQLVAQPLVLLYDVEKYRGLDGPLARWFAKYHRLLIDGARQKRAPTKWHGLWLYDRLTGRLIGFSDSNNPANENYVSLDQFYASITSPENLGANDCSFSEMVQRGVGDGGYFCAGAACNIDKQTQTLRTDFLSNPGAASTALSALEVLTAAGGQGRLPSDTFGAVCGATREAGSGSGSRVCPAQTPAGVSPMAQALACISSQAVPPGTEVMACLMEATGYCSNPVDRLTKDLRLTEFAGVPIGKACGIGEAGKNGSAGNRTPAYPLSPETRKELQDALQAKREAQLEDNLRSAAAQAAEAASQQAKADLQAAQAAEAQARANLQKASQGSNNPQAAADARAKLAEAERKTLEAQAKKNAADAAKAAADAKKAEAAAKKQAADARAKEAEDKAKQEQDKKKREEEQKQQQQANPNQARCDPDSPGCDLNKCTAMSESAQRTLECMKKAAPDQPLPGFMARSLGCDPTNCDPELSTAGRQPRGGACLAQMDPNSAQTAVTKQCGIVHCASGESAFLTAGGVCGCGVAPAGSGATRLGGQCGELSYCESGKADYRNGACVCTSGATLPGGSIRGPRNPQLITIGASPSFLDLNPPPPPSTGSDPNRRPQY